MVHVVMMLLFSQPAAVPAQAAPAPAPAVKPVPVKAADAKPAATTPAPMTPEVKALVDRVQAFYEKTTDFVAEFRQDYTYKAFKRTQTSTGKVTYAKPAQMRWDYLTPSKRTFVLSKDQVTLLDPDALTLTTSSIATSQLSASVTFLWGQGKLADEFAIAQKDCAACKGTLLELTPLKPDPRFQKVLLEVDPKSAQVLKSTVVDPDGSENAITFSALRPNTGVKPDQFKLVAPPGTQVLDYTQMKPTGPPKP